MIESYVYVSVDNNGVSGLITYRLNWLVIRRKGKRVHESKRKIAQVESNYPHAVTTERAMRMAENIINSILNDGEFLTQLEMAEIVANCETYLLLGNEPITSGLTATSRECVRLLSGVTA